MFKVTATVSFRHPREFKKVIANLNDIFGEFRVDEPKFNVVTFTAEFDPRDYHIAVTVLHFFKAIDAVNPRYLKFGTGNNASADIDYLAVDQLESINRLNGWSAEGIDLWGW